jgi:hypothetical protein
LIINQFAANVPITLSVPIKLLAKSSNMPVFPFHRLTVDLTRCGPGQLGDKYYVLGFLETRNSLANELDEIWRAYAFSRLACAYRLDAFAPLRVDHADHHDLSNRRMFENRAFDFRPDKRFHHRV